MEEGEEEEGQRSDHGIIKRHSCIEMGCVPGLT